MSLSNPGPGLGPQCGSLSSGDYDRHLRKMRALCDDPGFVERPGEADGGVEADGNAADFGLGQLRIDEADQRLAAVLAAPDESTLLLSYASMPESVLRSAIRALAGIVTGQR